MDYSVFSTSEDLIGQQKNRPNPPPKKIASDTQETFDCMLQRKVWKQNLKAGPQQQRHSWAGFVAVIRVTVLLLTKPMMESNIDYYCSKQFLAENLFKT